jgi:carboxyl-terminal processing protease
MLKRIGPKLLAMVLLLVLALAGVVAYQRLSGISSAIDSQQLYLVQEAMAAVQQHYVDDIDRPTLVRNALKGMLAALDPHSAYLPPRDFTEMNIEISGSFSGIGIEINREDGKLLVVSPIDDSPAHRAGIQPGDQIWKIGGSLTRSLSLDEAVSRMRGPRGTRVVLTILREGAPAPLVFTLVRDIIHTKSLKGRILEPGYGSIRIAQFQEGTGEEFESTLEKLRKMNGGQLRGLVLDLRNNPGGLLEEAVAVANRFLGERPETAEIVSTRGREPGSSETFTATIGPKEPPYPLVVLVNGGSASASEIVAGALQDHRRAVIMGTQTFGKGSVQSVLQLPHGAGLKLTTARYYTPAGRSIQARGITPDILVQQYQQPAVTETDKQRQLREADLDGHLPADGDGGASRPVTKPRQPGKPAEATKGSGEKASQDHQLQRALELLRGLQQVSALGGIPPRR